MEVLHLPRHADVQEVGASYVPDLPEQGDYQGKIHLTKIDHCSLGFRSDWLQRAARLPGKSMHLAVVLLLIAIAQKTRCVVLGNLACKRFGLNRNAKYRALCSLESAGLVAIQRKLGRSPIVTILDRSSTA
jgi:hypothetical protein